MTTAAQPIPPHGTDARYKGNRTGTRPPCRCKPCTRAHRKADLERELIKQRGGRNLVPIEEVLPHIEMLRASGMSQTLIARQAGVSQAVISYITTGRNKTCQTEKAERILGVQPRTFDGNAERPAIGSTRRVRALYSLGHGRAAISELSGLSMASISILAEGTWKIIDNRAATALAAAYRQLMHTRGTNLKNERRAVAEGWHGPLAWDDIDDPNCKPETGHRREGGPGRREAVDPADVARLAARGLSNPQIARELRCAERTVTRARGRLTPNDLKEAA